MEANNPFFPCLKDERICGILPSYPVAQSWIQRSRMLEASPAHCNKLKVRSFLIYFHGLLLYCEDSWSSSFNWKSARIVGLANVLPWGLISKHEMWFHDFFMGILMFDDRSGHQNLEQISDCQILRQIMRYPFLRVKGDSCLCSRRWRKLRVEMEKENSEWRWTKLKSFGGHTGYS